MKVVEATIIISIADPNAVTEFAKKTFLDKMNGNITYRVADPHILEGFELRVSRTGNLTFHRAAKALANTSAIPADILAMLAAAGYSVQAPTAQAPTAQAEPTAAEPTAQPVPLPAPNVATTPLACLASRNIESKEWRDALRAIFTTSEEHKAQNQRVNALVSAAGVSPLNGGELKALRNALTPSN